MTSAKRSSSAISGAPADPRRSEAIGGAVSHNLADPDPPYSPQKSASQAAITSTSEQALHAAGDLVACLANIIRFEILCVLGRSPRTVTELTDTLELDISSVSVHLRHLREGGFVTMQVDGHHHVYRLAEHLAVTETVESFQLRMTDHNGIDFDLVLPCGRLTVSSKHGS